MKIIADQVEEILYRDKPVAEGLAEAQAEGRSPGWRLTLSCGLDGIGPRLCRPTVVQADDCPVGQCSDLAPADRPLTMHQGEVVNRCD